MSGDERITLVDFLTARLDEDEQLAQDACPGPWIVRDWNEDTQFVVFSQRNTRGGVQHVANTELHGIKWRQNRDHIARHDPARVLREVEAKRRIMARHTVDLTSNWAGGDQELCAGCGCTRGGGIMPLDECPELRDLATVYADHADYREEWRP